MGIPFIQWKLVKMIEHENIIYISYISQIGGVETFAYELAKKYKDRDVAVVCKSIHPNQLKRLSNICWVYKHTDQYIKCKTAIINYDTSIINFICDEADIYMTIHADYEHKFYKNKFPQHNRIKSYIGITEHIVESFKRCTGNNNIILGYNPLKIDEPEPYLTLVSATRLSVIKGKKRMEALARVMDKAKLDYIWYVFTEDTDAIQSPNVVYMKPRLDVYRWIEKADYVIQLSDTEACSYTINEALYRNKPVIVTPLPYLKEIGYEDGKTGYTLKFDCENIEEVVEKMKTIPEFKFKPLKDIYGKLFTNKETLFKEDNMKSKVICRESYYDIELKRLIERDETLLLENDRAEHLIGLGLVELVERVKKEDKKKPTKRVEKR